MEQSAETPVGHWTAPECPFRIDYSARVLDDIRLAVMDAFFSLPRGGAEIGGILLGKWADGRISIAGHEPFDCEHAMGPSFTLSLRDQIRMAEMTAAARRNPADRQPVGWYHSHTRSHIFFSDADQDIHRRFFPEPWQVALVLKPHTFEPTRAGFFFREPDGSMRGDASYQEFQLDPLPPRPGTGSNSAAADRPRKTFENPSPSAASSLETADPPPASSGSKKGRVPITREIAIDPPLADALNGDGVAGKSAELDVPNFGQNTSARPWRAVKAAAVLAIGLAAGAVGYQTREYWLPKLLVKARAVLPREPDSYLSLAVSDNNGQLKIQWDRNAAAVRNALEATLEITDGNTAPRPVRLDSAHFAGGAFTYARENERVDVTLIATEPSGQLVKEQTSFLGKLPAQKQADAPPAADPESDAAAQRADQLQKDLNSQAAKTRKLEKDLKDMREQMQKGRPDSPPPDPAKKD